jgi:tRNA modification GTPase
MKREGTNTTIAAIATAYGESGIGIVRMSGDQALKIFLGLFRTASGRQTDASNIEPRRMMYGWIVDPATGNKLDEVLGVYMKAPHSYTAEDVVEIQCHGSIVSLRRILEACLAAGARPAAPGEFTQRAFLNGRIDLAQAEAVIDLICARTDVGFDAAFAQTEGVLSDRVNALRDAMLDLLVLVEANLDYPEEDIEEISYDQLVDRLQQINDELLKLLAYAREGKMIREGISVAIAGKPNVGKSSLLNFFVKENRAIVTEIPGTTRDTIEEQVSLSGIPVKLTDTAGIRESDDYVEQLGIERSKEAFARSDLILFLADASVPLSKEDEDLCGLLRGLHCIVLLNKSDLPTVIGEADIERLLPDAKILSTSLTEGIGLDLLEQTLVEWITGGKVRRREDVLLTNIRHIDLVRLAEAEMKEALAIAQSGEAMDFAAFHLRQACDCLGEITGLTIDADMLDRIFSQFCLGK